MILPRHATSEAWQRRPSKRPARERTGAFTRWFAHDLSVISFGDPGPHLLMRVHVNLRHAVKVERDEEAWAGRWRSHQLEEYRLPAWEPKYIVFFWVRFCSSKAEIHLMNRPKVTRI